MKQYDYLIVGAGLFGAVFAHEARKAGRRCLVIDRWTRLSFAVPGIPLLTKFTAEPRTRPCGLAHSLR